MSAGPVVTRPPDPTEVESERFRPPTLSSEHSVLKDFEPGLVPPPGPLPRRFGPSPALFWAFRAAALAILLVGGWQLGLALLAGDVDSGALLQFGGPAFLFLAWLIKQIADAMGSARRNSKLTRYEALGVSVEARGLTVSTLLWQHDFSWSELAGLEEDDDGDVDAIIATRDGRPVRIGLGAGWLGDLGASLRGGRARAMEERFDVRPPESQRIAKMEARHDMR